jgi:uncharacterized membrane protein YoaK (UPF0700 family)
VTPRDGDQPPVSLPQLRRDAASLRHPLTQALLVLTFTTGLVDATTYLGLGHVFAANMTGNIILLGFGIAGAGGLPVLSPIVSLAGFLVGAGLGGRLDSRLANRPDRGFRVVLAIEAAVMAAGAVIAAAVQPRAGHASGDLVVALLALGMGLRNATARALGIPDVTTTVLTMTLTGLAASSSWAGGDGRGTVRRTATVLAMLVGAIAGALLLKTSITLVLAVAAALTVGTLGGYRVLSARAGPAPGSGSDDGSRPVGGDGSGPLGGAGSRP